MACEGCAIKFTLFKRKKQCTDCLRFYCTNCLARRADRRLNCDKCRIISRRPLIRNQLLQMRSKDLQHFLTAKKISTRGCVEKEDLVDLLMLHANTSDSSASNETPSSNHDHIPFINTIRDFTSNIFTSSNTDIPQASRTESSRQVPRNERPTGSSEFTRLQQRHHSDPNVNRSTERANSTPSSRSRSPPNVNDRQVQQDTQPPNEESVPIISSPANEEAPPRINSNDVEIEELSDTECIPNVGPEPLVTEHEENSEESGERRSDMVIELPLNTGVVKLSDIPDPVGLESLSVKQLKDLLTLNRVDFKGCVERSELLDRASRLWQQNAKSREDLDGLGLEDLCKICMDAPVECVMLECGHMATCTNCGKQLSECPICRQYVVRVVRTFRA